MKKHRKKIGHRFKSTAYRQSSTTVLSELKPEEFSLSGTEGFWLFSTCHAVFATHIR